MENYGSDPGQPIAPLQPFRYNSLELYREHREEIDALNDLMGSFFFAYVSHVGRITLRDLWQNVGLAEDSLLQQIAPFLRSEMLTLSDGTSTATADRRRMLDGLSTNVSAAPIPVRRTTPVMPALMSRRLAALITATGGVAPAAVMLLFPVLAIGVSTVENRQPVALTPPPPAITATATHVPASVSTPGLPPSR